MRTITYIEEPVAEQDLDSTLATEPTPGAMAISSGDRDADALPPGTAVGGYIIEDTIAAGGGGTVFAAYHRTLGRRVAIKVLHAEVANSPQGLIRFQREAMVVNLVKHPGIVEIYDFGQLPDGRPYFVMELLQGSDLKRMITQRGRFSPDEMLEIVTTVCSALEAAHKAGVVHRDLKASNVHVAVEKGRYVVKLLDFGIAKLLQPDPSIGGLTQTGMRLGTASAMAPEQIRGEAIDQRVDVYALGVLIYHLLTGRYPFRGESRQEIERMNLETPPPRPSQAAAVPPAIDAVVLKCMDKRAERRYPSVSAALADLKDAVERRVAVAVSDKKRAVAVSVDVKVDGGMDEADDELLDEISQALDLAEQTLRQAQFVVALHTGTSLLAARVLPDDENAAREDRKRALEEAVSLGRQMSNRDGTALQVDVCLHVDTALVRGSAAAPEIAGAVVEVASWPAAANWNGIRATPATVAGLD
jgi:eukaryotic-like serine/threonine-protein kinase